MGSRSSPDSGFRAEARAALARAEGLSTPSRMTVVFSHPDQARCALAPSEIQTLADRAMEMAERQSGRRHATVKVLVNLGSMIVEAEPALLLALLENSDIQHAIVDAPAAGEIEPIRPVKKRPAADSGWV